MIGEGRMEPKKKGPPIIADASKCAGCLICELRCSLRFEKEFNPSKAAIQIRRQVGAEDEYQISFIEKCDNCGICARYCPYEALTQDKKVA
jgi:ferredoxin